MSRIPGAALEAGLQNASVLSFRDAGAERRAATLVVEEPLEIRISGEPLALTMRTPGSDHELVAGFLLAEGVIDSRDDLGTVAVCGRPGEPGYGNVVDVTLAPGKVFALEQLERVRRASLTTASCGVCGRQTIDDLLARCAPVDDALQLEPALVRDLTARLRAEQPNFARSGGLHAAGLADGVGKYLIVREDVGRHNAVDKVLGRALLDGLLPAQGRALVISGRASFEMVQKTLAAGIPVLVSVSAPSSLAVATAERTRLTLIGFSRPDGFNVYAGAERVLGSSSALASSGQR